MMTTTSPFPYIRLGQDTDSDIGDTAYVSFGNGIEMEISVFVSGRIQVTCYEVNAEYPERTSPVAMDVDYFGESQLTIEPKGVK